MAALPAVPLPPVRLGEPWWERDPDERKAEATNTDGRATYAGYLCIIAALSILSLNYFPPNCTASPASFDVNPLYGIPPAALLSFRVSAALMVFVVILRRFFEERQQEEETVDRRQVTIISHGMYRIAALTQWQFALVGVYFVLAVALQCQLLSGGSATAPSALACGTSTLFGVTFATAVLTTVTVTFVLVPAKIKRGVSPIHFFTWDELIMHNANSFVLVADLLLSRQQVQVLDLPHALLFGCFYVFFHHFVRYRYTRTLLYFFLNWKSRHAPIVLLVLLGAIASFFAIGAAVTTVLRPQPWGPPLVLALNVAIMRVRLPEVKGGKRAE